MSEDPESGAAQRKTSAVDHDAYFQKKNEVEERDANVNKNVVEERAIDSNKFQIAGKTFIVSTRNMVIGGCIIAVIFGVIILAVIVDLAVGLRDFKYGQHREKFCDKIEKYGRTKILEGSGLNKTPEVYDINRCLKKAACDFSVLACTSPCPLGYETEDDCVISCECATHGTMQLDIQFDEGSVIALTEQTYSEPSEDFTVFTPRSGIMPWTQNIVNGRPQIPYEFDEVLSNSQKKTLKKAFNIFKENTCIDFIPRYKENDYIYIQDGDGDCSASYSRHQGKNTVNIASCYSYSHVLHVLMHSLGFHHEHMREDRDSHIIILWDNVDPVYENAFGILNLKNYMKTSAEFDERSIMMLDGFAFSKTEEKTDPTMLNINTNETVVGGGSMFTEIDLRKIKSAYCGGRVEIIDLSAAEGRSLPTEGVTIELESGDNYKEWSAWTSWAGCKNCITTKVAYKTRFRHRDCLGYDENCVNAEEEKGTCAIENCNPPPVWSKWYNWSSCTKSCETGFKYRVRECLVEACVGPDTKMGYCCEQSCQEPAFTYSLWTSWSECPVTCEQSLQYRNRRQIANFGMCGMTSMSEDVEFQYKQCDMGACDPPIETIEEPPVEEDAFSIPPTLEELEFHQAFDLAYSEITEDNFCNQTSFFYWFVGDFNGDGKTDVMCGADINLMTIFLLGPGSKYLKQWSGRFDCAIDFMFVGDMNGDGAEDIFCKNALLSRNLVYRSKTDGFSERPVDVGPFCLNLFDTMTLLDVDGDGKSDIICRHDINKDDADVYINALSS